MAKPAAGKGSAAARDVRTGQGSVALDRAAFEARFLERFRDPKFRAVRKELEKVVEVAWRNYREDRKSPRTLPAGPGFADPTFELPADWLVTRRRLLRAQAKQARPGTRSRILVICGASRSDQSCPGEMSKTFRLVTLAKDTIRKARGFEVDVLDMSHLASEYGRRIHPCKACVSTAMPLCHWPCSCYPNHGQGQVNDWMAEIYERWVAAHGVLIVTPVYWYGAPGGLKSMIDRLVCADGGNPDPTTTGGKDPVRAKALELSGWSYPKHLAGRAFAAVVHGDVEGVDGVRRALADWLSWMRLVPAGHAGSFGRYVGYFEPYATSHRALDRDTAIQEEVRNAAKALVGTVRKLRAGKLEPPDEGLRDPRPK